MASLELANSLLQQQKNEEAQNILLGLTSRYKAKEIAAAKQMMDSAGEVHVCL